MPTAFTKMHGAGNDFVVLDRRDGQPPPDTETLVRIADRHVGIGCDQVMVLLPPRQPGHLAAYAVINGDGSAARQCGNGVRCLAAWLHRDGAFDAAAVLGGPSGPVAVTRRDDGVFEVELERPDFDPASLPMRGARAEAGGWRLPDIDDLPPFGAVAVGNPHVVIEVDDVDRAPVALAARLQSHPAFPDGCNVGFAQVIDAGHVRLRVVERGAGETLACGSGACAAQAWLRRLGKVGDDVSIRLPGGTLGVQWTGEPAARSRLRGPATFVFEGSLSP